MFIKWPLESQEKFKELESMYENAIYICIFDIAKFDDFQWKNDDVSRTQGVCHVIHIFFEYSLGEV